MRYQLLYCKSQPVSRWYSIDAVSQMVLFARRMLALGYEVSIWQHTKSGSCPVSLASFDDFLCV